MGLRSFFSRFTSQSSFMGIPVRKSRTFVAGDLSLTDIYSETIYIDSILSRLSTDISQMDLHHRRKTLDEHGKQKVETVKSDIEYLLNVAPNQLDTPATFFYDVAFNLLKDGLVLILPKYKSGKLKSLHIIEDYSLDLYSDGDYYVLIDGKEKPIHLDNFIVARDGASQLRSGIQELAQLLNRALSAYSAKLANGNKLQGFLKLGTSGSNSTVMKKAAEEKLETVLSAVEGTGIGVLGKDDSYQELNRDVKTIDRAELEFIKSQIFESYGVNEQLLRSEQSEEMQNMYLQSVIVPYQRLIIEAFEKALFTRTAYTQGHFIQNVPNVFRYTSPKDLAYALSQLRYQALISPNEARYYLGHDSFPGGDIFETNANAVLLEADREDELLYGLDQDDNKQSSSEGGETDENIS